MSVLKMCAADKVSFVYAMNRAYSHTFGAAGTKRIVYSCQIVNDFDSSVRTGLLTLHTTNTTVRADLSCYCALVVIGAFHHNSSGVVYDLDNIIGTFTSTHSAANAFFWIDVSNTVLDADSVMRTNAQAIAVSKTSKRTSLVTAVKEVCHDAAFRTVVIKLVLDRVARSRTSNESYLLNNVLSRHAENRSDLA